jgi:DNA-binding beta-propeller fold protein YncE
LGQDGNLYVADTWNNRVAVFALDGTFLRTWGHEGVPGTDTSGDAMWGPRDVKIGPDGNVYVADTGGKRIRVYAPDGTFLRDIGRGGSGIGEVSEPVGLAFNPISGELYVAESWNKRIQVFDLSGASLRTFTVNMWFSNNQSYNRPYLAVSPDGTLIYVTDMDDKHRVVAYNLSGQPVIAFNQPDKLDTGVLGVRSPAGMAFDAAGRLYVVDADQAKVFVFPPSQVSGNIAPIAPVQEPPVQPDSSQATPSPTVDSWPAG